MKKIRKLKFEIGEMLEDKISGYKGNVMARTEWYNGCVRYRLEPDHLNPDGELIESETFDEEQLIRVKEKKIKVPKKPTGGMRPNDVMPSIKRR
jgi:hypothetical protein